MFSEYGKFDMKTVIILTSLKLLLFSLVWHEVRSMINEHGEGFENHFKYRRINTEIQTVKYRDMYLNVSVEPEVNS